MSGSTMAAPKPGTSMPSLCLTSRRGQRNGRATCCTDLLRLADRNNERDHHERDDHQQVTAAEFRRRDQMPAMQHGPGNRLSIAGGVVNEEVGGSRLSTRLRFEWERAVHGHARN